MQALARAGRVNAVKNAIKSTTHPDHESLLLAYIRAGTPPPALALLIRLATTPSPTPLPARLFSIVAAAFARKHDHESLRRILDLMTLHNSMHPTHPAVKPTREFWNSLMAASFHRNTPDSIRAANTLFSNMHNPAENQQQQFPPPATDSYNIFVKHAIRQNDSSLVANLLTKMASSDASANSNVSMNLRTFHVLIEQSARKGMKLQTRRYIQQMLDVAAASSASVEEGVVSRIALTQETVRVLVDAYVRIGDVASAVNVFMEANTASIMALTKATTTTGHDGAAASADATKLGPSVTRECQIRLLEALAQSGDLVAVLRVYQTVVLGPFSHLELGDSVGRRNGVVEKANRYVLEALIRAGYVNEAAGFLLEGEGRGRLMGIVFGVVERIQREERLKGLKEAKEKGLVDRRKGADSLMMRMFDGNNSVTMTTARRNGDYVTTTSAFDLERDAVPSPAATATSSATIYPPILHTILLQQIIAQSTSPSTTTSTLLQHLQECNTRNIRLNLTAFTLVFDYIIKPSKRRGIPISNQHTLYEPITRLIQLCQQAGHVPKDRYWIHLLATLKKRVGRLQSEVSQAARRTKSSATTTSPLDAETISATTVTTTTHTIQDSTAATTNTTRTISHLLQTSLAIFESLAQTAAANPSKPLPASVLNNMLHLHLRDARQTAHILAQIGPLQMQTDAFTYHLLMRHASRVAKDVAGVKAFWGAYEQGCSDGAGSSELVVEERNDEEPRTTGQRALAMHAKPLRTYFVCLLQYGEWEEARGVLGRVRERFGVSPLDGAEAWWVRRYGKIVRVIQEADGLVKGKKVWKRMEAHGGMLWLGAGARRMKKRDGWERLVSSLRQVMLASPMEPLPLPPSLPLSQSSPRKDPASLASFVAAKGPSEAATDSPSSPSAREAKAPSSSKQGHAAPTHPFFNLKAWREKEKAPKVLPTQPAEPLPQAEKPPKRKRKPKQTPQNDDSTANDTTEHQDPSVAAKPSKLKKTRARSTSNNRVSNDQPEETVVPEVSLPTNTIDPTDPIQIPVITTIMSESLAASAPRDSPVVVLVPPTPPPPPPVVLVPPTPPPPLPQLSVPHVVLTPVPIPDVVAPPISSTPPVKSNDAATTAVVHPFFNLAAQKEKWKLEKQNAAIAAAAAAEAAKKAMEEQAERDKAEAIAASAVVGKVGGSASKRKRGSGKGGVVVAEEGDTSRVVEAAVVSKKGRKPKKTKADAKRVESNDNMVVPATAATVIPEPAPSADAPPIAPPSPAIASVAKQLSASDSRPVSEPKDEAISASVTTLIPEPTTSVNATPIAPLSSAITPVPDTRPVSEPKDKTICVKENASAVVVIPEPATSTDAPPIASLSVIPPGPSKLSLSNMHPLSDTPANPPNEKSDGPTILPNVSDATTLSTEPIASTTPTVSAIPEDPISSLSQESTGSLAIAPLLLETTLSTISVQEPAAEPPSPVEAEDAATRMPLMTPNASQQASVDATVAPILNSAVAPPPSAAPIHPLFNLSARKEGILMANSTKSEQQLPPVVVDAVELEELPGRRKSKRAARVVYYPPIPVLEGDVVDAVVDKETKKRGKGAKQSEITDSPLLDPELTRGKPGRPKRTPTATSTKPPAPAAPPAEIVYKPLSDADLLTANPFFLSVAQKQMKKMLLDQQKLLSEIEARNVVSAAFSKGKSVNPFLEKRERSSSNLGCLGATGGGGGESESRGGVGRFVWAGKGEAPWPVDSHVGHENRWVSEAKDVETPFKLKGVVRGGVVDGPGRVVLGRFGGDELKRVVDVETEISRQLEHLMEGGGVVRVSKGGRCVRIPSDVVKEFLVSLHGEEVLAQSALQCLFAEVCRLSPRRDGVEEPCWMDRFRPAHSTQLVGSASQSQVSKLREWLMGWKKAGKGGPELGVKTRFKKPSQSFVVADDDEEAEYECQGSDTDDSIEEVEDESESEEDVFQPIHSGPKKQRKRTRGGGGRKRRNGGVGERNLHLKLIGPVSSGRTNGVKMVAAECGYDVVEIHSGERRSGKDVLAVLAEATQSHGVGRGDGGAGVGAGVGAGEASKTGGVAVAGFFAPRIVTKDSIANEAKGVAGRKRKVISDDEEEDVDVVNLAEADAVAPPQSRPLLIVVEDADLLFEQDKGFWAAMWSIMEVSKRPIVFTCSEDPINYQNQHVPPHLLNNLESACTTIYFTPLPLADLFCYIHLLLLREGCWVDPQQIESLCRESKGDVRRCILQAEVCCKRAAGENAGLPSGAAAEETVDDGEIEFSVCQGLWRAEATERETFESIIPPEIDGELDQLAFLASRMAEFDILTHCAETERMHLDDLCSSRVSLSEQVPGAFGVLLNPYPCVAQPSRTAAVFEEVEVRSLQSKKLFCEKLPDSRSISEKIHGPILARPGPTHLRSLFPPIQFITHPHAFPHETWPYFTDMCRWDTFEQFEWLRSEHDESTAVDAGPANEKKDRLLALSLTRAEKGVGGSRRSTRAAKYRRHFVDVMTEKEVEKLLGMRSLQPC
ncbi:hypothetical protein HDU98_009111 [Podochytrium sp. JEL0797]|nr:hypothetical protein HDU98_009111 [Podochytrium sp. JEL0797]